MKRAALLCLFCLWMSLGQLLSASAQDTRTVSIDNCKLDYEDVNLTFDRTKHSVVWHSITGTYRIKWKLAPGCGLAYALVAPGIDSQPPCGVIPGSNTAQRFDYYIEQMDSSGNYSVCADPAVVVNDGRGFEIRSTKTEIHQQKNKSQDVKVSATALPHERSVTIDEACMPSATPNLYLSDKNTLVWTADMNVPAGTIFTVRFSGSTPCLPGGSGNGRKFQVTAGQPGPTCQLDPNATVHDGYAYDVSGPPSCKPFKGYVNVR